MIDHLAIDVSDLERSGRFYDAALKALGYKRLVETPQEFGGDSFLVGTTPRKPTSTSAMAHPPSRGFTWPSGQRVARRSTPSTRRRSLPGAGTTVAPV